MNEMIEKIISRHAIRRFQDRQLEEDVLEQILQAGLYAPSAGNTQYSRIVVCQDKDVNLRLGQLNRSADPVSTTPPEKIEPVSAEQPSIRDDLSIKTAFYNAPTVLALFTRDSRYAHDDAAFMAENMWLAAHFLGLGACYIGRAEETFATEYGRRLRQEWGVPEDMAAVGFLLLGYREGPAPHHKPRKEGRIIRI